MSTKTSDFHKLLYLNFLILSYIYIVLANDVNICGQTKSMFCNCDDNDNATDATCFILINGILPNDSAWYMFSTQPNIKKLKISSYNGIGLKHFPTDLFKLKSFKDSLHEVFLSDLDFKTLPTGAFENMSHLRWVDISLNPDMIIQKNAFNNLLMLEKVVITKSNISILPNMFEKVPMLRELYLEDNKIETFEEGCFLPLHNLSYLTLDRNLIKVIEANNFNGLKNLNGLELSYNRIKELPAQVFHSMPNLNKLDLSFNQIEIIHEDAFFGLNKLQELRLEHNKLTFIGKQLATLTNLMMVNLESNHLQAISKSSIYRKDQERYVHIQIKNNTLYCSCPNFWLKFAKTDELNAIKCYIGSTISNQTLFEFLMDNRTSEQCSLFNDPEPKETDDLETVPIDTINTLDEFDEQTLGGSPCIKNEFHDCINEQRQFEDLNGESEKEINRVGFNRIPNPPSDTEIHKENGAQSIKLVNSLLVTAYFVNLYTVQHMNILY